MTEIPNWFINDAIKNFSFYLPRFASKETKILQIGAYSGLIHGKAQTNHFTKVWTGNL